MKSGVMTALLVRLAVGLVILLAIYLGIKFFDPTASSALLNITITAAAIIILLAPTKWFHR